MIIWTVDFSDGVCTYCSSAKEICTDTDLKSNISNTGLRTECAASESNQFSGCGTDESTWQEISQYDQEIKYYLQIFDILNFVGIYTLFISILRNIYIHTFLCPNYYVHNTNWSNHYIWEGFIENGWVLVHFRARSNSNNVLYPSQQWWGFHDLSWVTEVICLYICVCYDRHHN